MIMPQGLIDGSLKGAPPVKPPLLPHRDLTGFSSKLKHNLYIKVPTCV